MRDEMLLCDSKFVQVSVKICGKGKSIADEPSRLQKMQIEAVFVTKNA
jgi:hypothetical protein